VTDDVRFLPPAAIDLDDRLCWPDVIVAEPEGFRPLLLDLFRPADATAAPVVIWIHGGGWRAGTNKRESPALAPARIGERILAAGYALARVTYRLSGEATFPAQLHDVKAAIRWLRHHSAELSLDPDRFAVWGESAGGHLASLAALTGDRPDLAGAGGILGVSDAVQAGIIWYGPSNLLSMAAQIHPQSTQDFDAPESAESRLVGGPIQRVPEASAAASPVTYASADSPPLLLVHGDDDRVVPDGQSRELHERIVSRGGPAELEIVPGADHGFVGAELIPLVDDGLSFLSRVLAG
jgi:acetyl esterase/lipase